MIRTESRSKPGRHPLTCLALVLLVGRLPALPLAAQAPGELYRLTVAGTTKALNYRYLDGQARVRLQGTVLQPAARGEAVVRSRLGGLSIHLNVQGLEPPGRLGPGYLTYVLWGITPTGLPCNLGEVVVRHGRARVEASTHLHTFGLVITAEPHFAVTRVSNAVVLENAPVPGSRGRVQEVEASYELLPRGGYPPAAMPADGEAAEAHLSPYVLQARMAVRIAEAEGAGRLAPVELQRARGLLERLEAGGKLWKKPAILLARQAIQEAEDARLMAVKGLEKERRALEQQATAEARQQAATARVEAEAARAEAEGYRVRALDAARKAQEKSQEARAASHQVTAEKRALRARLLEQLNKLLQTQDTEQGVIATLSDVLFPSGSHELSAGAREKLAKVAGILLAYPGLSVRIEGHCDSTGREPFNRKLSEQRAAAVRNFVIKLGLPANSVISAGLGSARPVAENETPDGRRQNRRVELILGGEPIGF